MEVNLYSLFTFLVLCLFTVTYSFKSNPMALFPFTVNGIRMIPSDKTCQSPMTSFFLPSFVLILDLHLFLFTVFFLLTILCR